MPRLSRNWILGEPDGVGEQCFPAGIHDAVQGGVVGMGERVKAILGSRLQNALHLNQIRPVVGRLMYISGFNTIRLGLETSDMELHERIDKKVGTGDFERAIENLLRTGFKKQELGAYILMGLPDQSVESVARTITFADTVGAIPYLAEYSPLPGTQLFEKAVESSEYDIVNEPLFQNNRLLPCWNESKREKVPELRKMVKGIRERQAQGTGLKA